MAHEVLDGHRVAWRNEIERDLAFGILLLFPDHHILERRDVLGYRVVKGEPSVFKQHHCRHCGDRHTATVPYWATLADHIRSALASQGSACAASGQAACAAGGEPVGRP